MIPLFVGYDPRESVVFHVCVNSLIRHASQPFSVTPLALKNLRDYEERHGDGSNQFIYSRFLVPHITAYDGWAIFIDGDMIVRSDITELWSLRDESKAVMVVKHNYKTKSESKYLGSRNENYPRKNWSSVILWNCAHPRNKVLTPSFVQAATGAQLHRFQWLDDDLIGDLPIAWNWLPDELGVNADAKLLHWTLGAPSFHEYSEANMASEWHRERILAAYCEQQDID